MDAGTNRNAPARRSFLAFLLLLCALALACAAHAREASAPEGVAKAFYAWYIGKDAAGVYPLLDQGIGDYVAAATVDGLRAAYRRNELPGDADYFLKVQDYDEADFGPFAIGQSLTHQPCANPTTLPERMHRERS